MLQFMKTLSSPVFLYAQNSAYALMSILINTFILTMDQITEQCDHGDKPKEC